VPIRGRQNYVRGFPELMKRRPLHQTGSRHCVPWWGFALRHYLRSQILLSVGLLLIGASAGTAQTKNMNGSTNQTEIATLGGGCFWCVEAAIVQLQGVVSVRSGYMGGASPNPTYQQVCSGKSGRFCRPCPLDPGCCPRGLLA